MKQYDAVVIGGGILGGMLARNLRRWNITTLLLEKEDDVCKGITRANSAIVYPGYDNKPGSLKAQMTVRANAYFDRLCDELDVDLFIQGKRINTQIPVDNSKDIRMHS